MKTRYLPAIMVIFINIFLIGCENEENDPSINGSLINHTDCKTFKSAVIGINNGNNESCIEYSYDSQNRILQLKHINAGFNCCPDSLYCKISLSNDTILIEEFEKNALCNCNCLYDLNIEIKGVELKKYYISIVEPYCGEQQKLMFEVDFNFNSSGKYCVNRNHYPWGF